MTQRRGPRRRTAWIDTRISLGTVNNGEQIKSLLSDWGTRDTEGVTMTRVIGSLWFASPTSRLSRSPRTLTA